MTEDFLSAPPESPLVISERSVTVLKQPVWIWSVPVYFYLGSTAGTAAALAFAAQTADAYRFRNVISKARGISAGSLLLGSVLLIHDLGRPSRFLNMLRVFKLSSPMSVGSWLLATTTPLVMLAAAFSNTSSRVLHRIGSLSGAGSGVLGLPLAGYTGVLLGTTAVPVWKSSRTLLPPLFLSSGAASAAELIQISSLNISELKALARLGVFFRSAELITMLLLSRKLRKNRGSSGPLRSGASGKLWKAAVGLALGGLWFHSWKPTSRRMRILKVVTGIVGGLSLRFALLEAGKESARNPGEFESQGKS
ncbi:MAG TPA: NrfD/PsrC family molybdoenzyme membrane anchor subunit [Acidobacteriota bacterium]|nr:NrfD/PsrC family molybdoenzyme membrane anchor subunit [Acidobacteriota bacterium]